MKIGEQVQGNEFWTVKRIDLSLWIAKRPKTTGFDATERTYFDYEKLQQDFPNVI